VTAEEGRARGQRRAELRGGAERADKAIDAGIVGGLHYAVGFLAGCGAAFLDHGRTSEAHAFTAAAGELGRVTPEQVRRDWPDE
jgi:hypothetical protein